MILETKAILFITVAMGTLAHCLERQRHQKNAEAAVCGIGSKSAGPAVGDEEAMRAYDRVRRPEVKGHYRQVLRSPSAFCLLLT